MLTLHLLLAPTHILFLTFACFQEILELQRRINELKNFKKDAESKLPDFVNVAAEKGDLEDQLRSLQKVGFKKPLYLYVLNRSVLEGETLFPWNAKVSNWPT